MALGLLFNKTYYQKEFKKIVRDSSLLLLGGFLAIAVGFLILQYHHTWTASWVTIITLVGWVSLIKGIVLLAFPRVVDRYRELIFRDNHLNYYLLPLLAILGLVFGYFGWIHV